MVTTETVVEHGDDPDRDDRVVFRGLSWWQFETMLAVRGDRSTPRFYYLEGELEILSPGRNHEHVKTLLARLLEAYAEEQGLRFDGFGSSTMRNAMNERAAEPDECYFLRPHGGEDDFPDLALEVIWTSGGVNKRRLYAGLGVRELWEWRRVGGLTILKLQNGAYQQIARSELLPDLDLELLARHVELDDQTAAVRSFRSALRAPR